MLECPTCSYASDVFTVFGTLVTGEMSVRVNAAGQIEQLGPIKPKMLIKQGSELKGHFLLTCPNCHQCSPPSDFRLIRMSDWSGTKRADVCLVLDDMSFHIHSSEETMVRDGLAHVSSYRGDDRTFIASWIPERGTS